VAADLLPPLLIPPSPWLQLQQALAQTALILVQVQRVEGSGPREVGAWMAVGEGAPIGTIGGGQLEHEALAQAREALRTGRLPSEAQRYALGPSLGQCCGGVMWLSFERVEAHSLPRLHARLAADSDALRVALFGGGHVGRALVSLLATLPMRMQWVDSRDEIFPAVLPECVQVEHSDPVQAAVADLVPGSHVLVMSFSHAEDLEIVAACVRRQRERGDLPFIGLIGSRSKWARFQSRLRERGFSETELAAVRCPIGIPGIVGKQPEVIAVSVAAQLLTLHASRSS